jgi:hypothetical protein
MGVAMFLLARSLSLLLPFLRGYGCQWLDPFELAHGYNPAKVLGGLEAAAVAD